MKKVIKTVLLAFTGLLSFAACSQSANSTNSPTETTTAQTSQVTHISQTQLDELQKTAGDDVVLIDVRSGFEFKGGHIKGAVNIPHSAILKDVSLLDDYKNANKKMVIFCRSGARAGRVTSLLTELNYTNIYHLKGDMIAWKAAKRPLEK